MSVLFFDINHFVDTIFRGDPQPPCTFCIKFKEIPINQRNKILFKILLKGARKKFGEQITIDNIDNHQYHILNKYLLSMGYHVNYSLQGEHQTLGMQYCIWFDQIKIITNCNGTKIIQKI
jgi:hypothetical protein